MKNSDMYDFFAALENAIEKAQGEDGNAIQMITTEGTRITIITLDDREELLEETDHEKRA